MASEEGTWGPRVRREELGARAGDQGHRDLRGHHLFKVGDSASTVLVAAAPSPFSGLRAPQGLEDSPTFPAGGVRGGGRVRVGPTESQAGI